MSFLQPARRNGKAFVNPVPTVVMLPGTSWQSIRDFFVGGGESTPKRPLGPFHTDTTLYRTPPSTGLRVTWMGHSTLLIEIDGKRILTDPVWSSHASPVPILFAKRFYPPPLPLDQLPPLDLVLLSHDHYDHLDAPTIKRLARTDVPFVCSLGMGEYLKRWGVPSHRITELDWTGETSLGDIKITAVPARHFSGRGSTRFGTLWSAFVIKGPRHSIFFGADSGPFTEGYREIGNVYGPFDLTMLEIGAYGPYWPQIHLSPPYAAEGHLALRGEVLLPIHWGLFNLAYHPWREPVEWIIREAEEKGIKLLLPRPGEPMNVTGDDYRSGWWENY
jgi:L-ascorbate metabolism protein UlaG (beta-lactamase superfamily)